ncbi:putative RNA polymerase sigma factor (ECF subfamily) protein [Plesiocystis pacifica SIR-1]|uniref:Putative RNA polymerase sigma factor (ECF subfamily) protein n=1 Tax=Plesiocystis pacifica SIR-1 TaxID=391625 RepID=A6GJ99_9BACT|nr:putative RNA polymerase sigma factor (ECF subfamily) protein [Plesiocystis pacifica SIR-1]
MWRNARLMLPGANDSDVEDLVQETFTVAYRRFAVYDGRASPTTWLFGILRNVARNHHRGERRRSRRRAALADAERWPVGPRGEEEQLLARSLLDEFLAELGPNKRAIFVLTEIEGMTAGEIGEALGVNVNTVSTRLRAARKQFCAHFELPRSRAAVRERARELAAPLAKAPREQRERTRAGLLVVLAPELEAARGGGLAGGALAKPVVLQLAGAVVGLASVAGVVWALGVGEPEPEPERLAEPRVRTQVEGGALAPVDASSLSPPPERPGPSAVFVPVARAQTQPSAPSNPRERPSATSASAKADDGREEDAFAQIREARAALVADDPHMALEILAKLPAGQAAFRGQRVATEVAALCALERGDEAEARLRALAEAEPSSPMLPRLEHACW